MLRVSIGPLTGWLAHCELAARRAELIEQKRVSVRARLEQELGPELTHVLLSGLAA